MGQGVISRAAPRPRSFVAGVIHPWRVSAFERLLWRACRGYLVASFVEMPEPMEDLSTVSGALAGRGGGWRGRGTGAEVDCAVPRARASPGSSSSSPTGASRSGRRSARSRTGEAAAAPLATQRFIQQDPLWRHPMGTDRVTPWHPPTRRCPSVCPSFHCHVYPYPESEASRVDTMNGLHSQIQDLSVVSGAPRRGTGRGGHGRTPLPSP